MSATPTKVFPIPGRFAVGIPRVAHEVPTKGEAEDLVATGYFALSEAEANAAAHSTPETTEADDSNVRPRVPADDAETATVSPPETSTAQSPRRSSSTEAE